MPMLLNMHSISSYFSVQNGAVNDFNKTLMNSENTMNNPTRNVDNRTTMTSLLNTKYLFAHQDEVGQSKIPYGFKILKNKNGKTLMFKDQPVYSLGNGTGTVVYENKYALPLAYTQGRQFSRQSYQSLSATDKEQALLSGVQTSKRVAGVKTIKAATTSKRVSYQVSTTSSSLTTMAQAREYQMTHNTVQSLYQRIDGRFSGTTANQKVASTATTQPTQAVKQLLARNQAIVTKNRSQNAHGLKTMTGDALGQNASYRLTIKNPERYQNCELYIEFDGIKAQFPSAKTRLDNAANRALIANVPFSPGTKLNAWRNIMNRQYFNSYGMTVTTQNKAAAIRQLGINNMSDYEKKGSVLLNLGYATKARKTIDLEFYEADQIKFKQVRIIAVPFGKSYQQKTQALQKQQLKQLKVTNNLVTGTTNRTQTTVLTTSIPYSSGWHLTVDGHKVATQKVNTGFVGGRIPAGQHKIRLSYETPGLKVGRLASVVGLILLIGGIGVELVRFKRQ